jgi:hypothetical protein
VVHHYTSCVHMAICLLEIAGFSAVGILISSLCCGDIKELAILQVAVFFFEGSCTLQLRAPLPGYHIFCLCLRGSSASVLSSLSSDVWSHIAHEDLSLRRCCGGLSQAIARGQIAIWTPCRQNRWPGFAASIRQHFQSLKQTVPLPSLFVRHCYPQPAAWPLPYVLPLYYGTCLYNPPSQLVHALVVTVMVPSAPVLSFSGLGRELI